MSITAEPTFSLKDSLFNKNKVTNIAHEIQAVYQAFETTKFTRTVIQKFPELELMERLYWIRDCLRDSLPNDYRQAVTLLVQSLPAPCDPDGTDNDFGDFIYGPYGAFVAEYGCTKEHLQFSLQALKAMTTRFSVEFPMRSFINAFPTETVKELQHWAKDKHYHVRRLASEATRPSLPWAKRISIDYHMPMPILNVLYADKTRFVTRSVANHLNDISKLDPALVVTTLKRWEKEQRQRQAEMDFIRRHSLRTLEKRGYAPALELLGYNEAKVSVAALQVLTPTVTVGEALEFSFTVTSTAAVPQKLVIDYHLFFQKANGGQAPKTFKITKTSIKPGETLEFKKQQPLRPMTTRTLYPGKHSVELQINGKTYPRKDFSLEAS